MPIGKHEKYIELYVENDKQTPLSSTELEKALGLFISNDLKWNNHFIYIWLVKRIKLRFNKAFFKIFGWIIDKIVIRVIIKTSFTICNANLDS